MQMRRRLSTGRATPTCRGKRFCAAMMVSSFTGPAAKSRIFRRADTADIRFGQTVLSRAAIYQRRSQLLHIYPHGNRRWRRPFHIRERRQWRLLSRDLRHLAGAIRPARRVVDGARLCSGWARRQRNYAGLLAPPICRRRRRKGSCRRGPRGGSACRAG